MSSAPDRPPLEASNALRVFDPLEAPVVTAQRADVPQCRVVPVSDSAAARRSPRIATRAVSLRLPRRYYSSLTCNLPRAGAAERGRSSCLRYIACLITSVTNVNVAVPAVPVTFQQPAVGKSTPLD